MCVKLRNSKLSPQTACDCVHPPEGAASPKNEPLPVLCPAVKYDTSWKWRGRVCEILLTHALYPLSIWRVYIVRCKSLNEGSPNLLYPAPLLQCPKLPSRWEREGRERATAKNT